MFYFVLWLVRESSFQRSGYKTELSRTRVGSGCCLVGLSTSGRLKSGSVSSVVVMLKSGEQSSCCV